MQYLLKLSISLAIVYLFYMLVLRRLTFHTWNRWYLVGYTAIAFLIPFVDISLVLSESRWNQNEVVQMIPVLQYAGPVQAGASGADNWVLFMFWALMAGIFVTIARLIIQYSSFIRLRRRAILVSEEDIKLFHVDKPISPFSFGDSIYVNLNQHQGAELQEIIRHEFIHVKQRHTFDILFAEFVCVLNWYNPFAWLIRKAIRQNLEFIADRHVLQSGVDRKEYQYLLLKVLGTSVFSISHPFNYSSLKKRIVMMNKITSARIHLVKFLFILPLVTVLLLAFRNQAQQQEPAGNNIIVTTLPSPERLPGTGDTIPPV